MTHHMDKLETALSLLDEARGFAAMSPGGRENIIAVEELLPEITELAYRSGFEDGEKHAAEHAEIEHKRNSSFVPVHKTGTHVPSETDAEIEAICGEIKRLRTENKALRNIISQCAASLGNGAAIMPTCTVEFMAELPREIELVTSGLRSELSTAYRRGRKDMLEEAAKVADARMYDFGCIAGTEAYDFVKICAELAAAIRKLEA